MEKNIWLVVDPADGVIYGLFESQQTAEKFRLCFADPSGLSVTDDIGADDKAMAVAIANAYRRGYLALYPS